MLEGIKARFLQGMKVRRLRVRGRKAHVLYRIIDHLLEEVKTKFNPRPPPPPIHTHTLYSIRVQYKVHLFTKGRGVGERVEPERRLEGQQFTKLGRKYQHD